MHDYVYFAKRFTNMPVNFLYTDNQDWPSHVITRCPNLSNIGFNITNDAFGGSEGYGLNKTITVFFYACGF